MNTTLHGQPIEQWVNTLITCAASEEIKTLAFSLALDPQKHSPGSPVNYRFCPFEKMGAAWPHFYYALFCKNISAQTKERLKFIARLLGWHPQFRK
jgi:hypothetical protein